MSAYRPVRLERGVNHLARRAGGTWAAVCGRQVDPRRAIVQPQRLWARVWQHEQVCADCDAIRRRATSDRDLDRRLRLR